MRILVVTVVALPAVARADEPKVTLGGYVETYYTVHAQDPSNRVVSLRGFDIASRSFRLSNVVLDAKGEAGPITAHLALQIGDTPTTYYASEPQWKYIQVANVTAKAPRDFVIEAGLFPSPIGPEVIPIKDNWNWSRSNLFYGLPFYHLGAAVSHVLGDTPWTAKIHVYNGWNQLDDTNSYPSVAASAAYARDATTVQLLYFGGVERAAGAPEGQPWRHLADALIQTPLTGEVTVMAQLDVGLERNDIGDSAWVAVAGYAKVQLSAGLFAAVRGDYFREQVARMAALPGMPPITATPIFWPVQWVGEGTATLAYQPMDHVSLRLEYRHDQAASSAYFGGVVATDPATLIAIPNREMQDTFTLGATAWF
jgi:hypothetical protein